jgi:hypothetical protein
MNWTTLIDDESSFDQRMLGSTARRMRRRLYCLRPGLRQGDTLDELRAMVKDAVHCYFDETIQAPKIIRLCFVREEILAA